MFIIVIIINAQKSTLLGASQMLSTPETQYKVAKK